jgi:hypothetical protein
MITEREKQFITYWESVRDWRSKFINKLMSGLPMAILFGLPIFLSLVVVYFYFPDFYTKISNTSSGTLITVGIAILIAIIFFAYFRMHYKWEMNEQLYKELKSKQTKAAATADL